MTRSSSALPSFSTPSESQHTPTVDDITDSGQLGILGHNYILALNIWWSDLVTRAKQDATLLSFICLTSFLHPFTITTYPNCRWYNLTPGIWDTSCPVLPILILRFWSLPLGRRKFSYYFEQFNCAKFHQEETKFYFMVWNKWMGVDSDLSHVSEVKYAKFSSISE